jgi:hypothetical protein
MKSDDWGHKIGHGGPPPGGGMGVGRGRDISINGVGKPNKAQKNGIAAVSIKKAMSFLTSKR